MKVKLIGHSFRTCQEPFTYLVFKIIYTSNRKDKVLHYWKEDNVIQREGYLESGNFSSYPVNASNKPSKEFLDKAYQGLI
jgi:hypothetical protein